MRKLLSIAVCAACVLSAYGQNAGPDAATMREWVSTFEKDVRNEKLNIDLIRAHIRRLDRETEKQVADVLGTLAGLEDSAATNDRIREAKERMIAGLRRSVDFYLKVREQEKAQGWDTGVLDDRIDARLEQMASLAASIGDRKTARPAGRVLDGDDMEDALEALKEGETMGHVVANRDDLIEELNATIDYLSKRQRILTRKLDYLENADSRAAVQKEIADLDAKIAKRRTQVEEARKLPEPPKELAGMDTVREVEKTLREARQLVLRNHREMVEQKEKLDYARKRLEHLEGQLAKAKALLARMTGQGN